MGHRVLEVLLHLAVSPSEGILNREYRSYDLRTILRACSDQEGGGSAAEKEADALSRWITFPWGDVSRHCGALYFSGRKWKGLPPCLSTCQAHSPDSHRRSSSLDEWMEEMDRSSSEDSQAWSDLSSGEEDQGTEPSSSSTCSGPRPEHWHATEEELRTDKLDEVAVQSVEGLAGGESLDAEEIQWLVEFAERKARLRAKNSWSGSSSSRRAIAPWNEVLEQYHE